MKVPVYVVAALFGWMAGVAQNPGAVAAEFSADQLCRQFSGEFRWDGSKNVQEVSIKLKSVTAGADGILIAMGSGSYQSANDLNLIKVKWQINTANNDFEMWEFNTTAVDFTTDGSHKGKISAGFTVIDARWTTVSTGNTGTLHLEAAKNCAQSPGGKASEPGDKARLPGAIRHLIAATVIVPGR